MSNKIEKIFIVIALIVLIYLSVSFIDVVFHNLTDQQFAFWNVFNIVWGGGV